MLTRMKITNFKALRDVDLSLRQRNVFIGPNKSGKSSILQVLNALTSLMNEGDANKVFAGQLGFQNWLWKGVEDGDIGIEMWGDTPPQQKGAAGSRRFHYAIAIGLDALHTLTVKDESLEVTDTSTGKIAELISARMGAGAARRTNGELVFKDPGSPDKPFLSYEIPGWEADELRKYIQQWQFFRFIPELPRLSAPQSSAQPFLDTSGAQLSSWLHTFHANAPEAFRRVVEAAKEAFPEIESLATPVTQAGTTFLTSKERGLLSPVPVFHASEGEIKFLQLLSVIFSPFGASLVAIEEPENHLHPGLVELLVETADRVRTEVAPHNSQVFVTTHSPFLVDKLAPEDVIVVDKIDGATRCLRVTDSKNLKRLLEEGELSFGQLWYSGALGGV